jgi:hypothetical protein
LSKNSILLQFSGQDASAVRVATYKDFAHRLIPLNLML